MPFIALLADAESDLTIYVPIAAVVAFAALAPFLYLILLTYRAQQSIPVEHQKLQPSQVWLLLVPFLNILIAFIIAREVPRSFRSYLQSNDDCDDSNAGDCGKSAAMAWALAQAALFLRLVASTEITGVELILFVLGSACFVSFVVKISQLKRRIEAVG